MDVEKSPGFHLAVFYFSACEKKKGREGVCVCVCIELLDGRQRTNSQRKHFILFFCTGNSSIKQVFLWKKIYVIFLLKFCKIKMCIFICYYYVMLLFSAGRLCIFLLGRADTHFPPLVQSMGGDKTTNDQLVELNA